MVKEQHRSVGRPPKEGARYDCGRRKPMGDPRGHAVWQFLKHHGDQLGLDPRLRTELGRLAYAGELTDRQVEAGHLVARIYGDYERHKRRRRSTASPSYMRSFGDPDGADDPIDPEELTSLERKIRGATSRFEKLQETIRVLPEAQLGAARAILEALCVEDRAVGNAGLEIAAPLLDYIAQCFDLPGAPAQTPSIAITARRPRRQAPRTAARRTDLDREAFNTVTHAMRPELDADGIQRAWDLFQALKDRSRLRRQKARA